LADKEWPGNQRELDRAYLDGDLDMIRSLSLNPEAFPMAEAAQRAGAIALLEPLTN
jgi:hypothetical protein